MSLSDRVIKIVRGSAEPTFRYDEDDVKKSIKRLKKKICEWDWQAEEVMRIIDEEMGPKLISTRIPGKIDSPTEQRIDPKVDSVTAAPEDTSVKGCGEVYLDMTCGEYKLCDKCKRASKESCVNHRTLTDEERKEILRKAKEGGNELD